MPVKKILIVDDSPTERAFMESTLTKAGYQCVSATSGEDGIEKAKAEFGAKVSGLEGKLKERDGSIARLMATIKEHETAIKKLTESGESWKRKYQFLATDQPDAYKSAGEK